MRMGESPLKTNMTCTVIEQGTWSYAKNRLKLSYVSSRTRYSTGWAFDNKNPSPRLLIVIWRRDGSFELRRDPDEMKREMLRVSVSDVEVYYDENGTLHYGGKLPGGRAYSSTETAKIFKKVQMATEDRDEG